MKYAIASEHRDFFQKNGAIEFDELFNEEQLSQLMASIPQTLQARLKVSPDKFEKISTEKQFYAGRDLWRDSPVLKKLITHNRLAEIASELVQYKPLRLGYDQYYPPVPSSKIMMAEERQGYSDLMGKEISLNEISSLQGILCGLMICLEGNNTTEPAADPEAMQVNIFASKAGNGVFLAPDKRIDFGKLRTLPSQRYLLVVYTSPTTIYILREDDPHTHALKRLGYVFGDKLSDKLNPIIYR